VFKLYYVSTHLTTMNLTFCSPLCVVISLICKAIPFSISQISVVNYNKHMHTSRHSSQFKYFMFEFPFIVSLYYIKKQRTATLAVLFMWSDLAFTNKQYCQSCILLVLYMTSQFKYLKNSQHPVSRQPAVIEYIMNICKSQTVTLSDYLSQARCRKKLAQC
jgi:hypothetical protein